MEVSHARQHQERHDARYVRGSCNSGGAALQECVETSPDRLGGVPVLRGTRFSVSQLFAELADSAAVDELADDLELDPALLKKFLHALAMQLDKPIAP